MKPIASTGLGSRGQEGVVTQSLPPTSPQLLHWRPSCGHLQRGWVGWPAETGAGAPSCPAPSWRLCPGRGCPAPSPLQAASTALPGAHPRRLRTASPASNSLPGSREPAPGGPSQPGVAPMGVSPCPWRWCPAAPAPPSAGSAALQAQRGRHVRDVRSHGACTKPVRSWWVALLPATQARCRARPPSPFRLI